MQPRSAATVAGAAAVAVVAGALGLGAAFGLFDLAEPDAGRGTDPDPVRVAAVSNGFATEPTADGHRIQTRDD